MSRVDGPAKVTGQAKYAAEFNVPDLAYGVAVPSAIAKGRIKSIDRSAALSVPGVIDVFAHDNRPSVASSHKKYTDEAASPGSPFRPLYDETILFAGQPIALVVAKEFEIARFAATLVAVDYEEEKAITDLDTQIDEAYDPPNKRMESMAAGASRGDADKALSQSPIREKQEYRTPIEHHNPMECFGSTALWDEDGRLTIYDKTQGAQNSHQYVCNVFGLAKDKVRILSPFVGGAFGCGLRPQYQLFLAAMAAIALKRPVRVTLTRQQMLLGFGHRPQTIQTLSLGAEENGHLTAIKHDAVANTSRFEDYQENVVNWAGSLYRCDNSKVSHKLAQLDLATPMDMRAPGAAAGVYALECAMDELSYALGIDPLELRLKNYSDLEQNAGQAVFQQGAEGLLLSRRREIRLVEAQAEAALDAGGARAYRLRHGERNLGSIAGADQRRSRAHARGKTFGQHSGSRYRHRHLYYSCADRRRDARPAARPGRDQDRRFRSAGLPRRRWVMDGGLGRLRRHAGLREHPSTAAQARAKAQGFAAEGRGTRGRRLRRRQDRAPVRPFAR